MNGCDTARSAMWSEGLRHHSARDSDSIQISGIKLTFGAVMAPLAAPDSIEGQTLEEIPDIAAPSCFQGWSLHQCS